MSEEPRELEADELLRVVGRVRVPEPGVLEDAREVLWSAIAGEMTGTRPAGERSTVTGELAGGGEAHRRRAQRRQAGQSDGARGMSAGGGDVPER